MESQSISQDGYLLRCKAADSSHGASVKSRLAISGSGVAGCCCWNAGREGGEPAECTDSSPSVVVVDAEALGESGAEAVPAAALGAGAAARPWQMAVSLASTEASSGPARCAPALLASYMCFRGGGDRAAHGWRG